jgi:D-glycero-beta-D-manno-heptose-7-phosphate kinase
LLLTRGGEGMSLFERLETGQRRTDIPTTARSVYDVTGAGDTAIAAFVAALASGCDLESAARLSNVAAGIKVGKRGTACVSLLELIESIEQEAGGQAPSVFVQSRFASQSGTVRQPKTPTSPTR